MRGRLLAERRHRDRRRARADEGQGVAHRADGRVEPARARAVRCSRRSRSRCAPRGIGVYAGRGARRRAGRLRRVSRRAPCGASSPALLVLAACARHAPRRATPARRRPRAALPAAQRRPRRSPRFREAVERTLPAYARARRRRRRPPPRGALLDDRRDDARPGGAAAAIGARVPRRPRARPAAAHGVLRARARGQLERRRPLPPSALRPARRPGRRRPAGARPDLPVPAHGGRLEERQAAALLQPRRDRRRRARRPRPRDRLDRRSRSRSSCCTCRAPAASASPTARWSASASPARTAGRTGASGRRSSSAACCRPGRHLANIRRLLADVDAGEQRELLQTNERYTFFRLTEGEPVGSLGVELTPGRSVATDPRLVPPGAIGYLVTPTVRRFVVSQDTGGAIIGAHADLFLGSATRRRSAPAGRTSAACSTCSCRAEPPPTRDPARPAAPARSTSRPTTARARSCTWRGTAPWTRSTPSGPSTGRRARAERVAVRLAGSHRRGLLAGSGTSRSCRPCPACTRTCRRRRRTRSAACAASRLPAGGGELDGRAVADALRARRPPRAAAARRRRAVPRPREQGERAATRRARHGLLRLQEAADRAREQRRAARSA